jgi:hypothetical protein
MHEATEEKLLPKNMTTEENLVLSQKLKSFIYSLEELHLLHDFLRYDVLELDAFKHCPC